MVARYASAKHAFGFCDYCGQRYPLRDLRKLVRKKEIINIKVCPRCWEPDQPQLMVGEINVSDPQALFEPRPDNNIVSARDIQWGWSPVGFNNSLGLPGLKDALEAACSVGTVTVET